MPKMFPKFVFLLIGLVAFFKDQPLQAFSANKVWFEFRPEFGRYRVYVNYTVPALREFREVYVDFTSKKEAEKYFSDLIAGADFYMPHASKREFQRKPATQDPW